MSDHAALINANSDYARKASQYAATFDLSLDYVHTYPTFVEARVSSFDHAQRLAAGFDLNESRSYKHEHGREVQQHTVWFSPAHPLRVTNVSRWDVLGRTA